MKLNLGCGHKKFPGYINIDANPAHGPDLVSDTMDNLPYENDSCEEIKMEAFFEHLHAWEHVRCLKEWHRLLRPGGKLIINWIPDFKAIAKLYLAGATPGLVSPKFDLFEVYRFTHGDPSPQDRQKMTVMTLQLHKYLFDREYVESLFAQVPYKEVNIKEEAVCKTDPHGVHLNIVAVK
jgi:predicted SAM-dependent methyltransferase